MLMFYLLEVHVLSPGPISLTHHLTHCVISVNLALADFMVCLICLPPTMLDDVTETWYMGSIMCKIVKYLQVRMISNTQR